MYTYTPEGVCAKQISFDIIDGKVENVSFLGGCDGNGKGIAVLAEGHSPEELIEKLSKIKCKQRSTSCPAQLAEALRKITGQGL